MKSDLSNARFKSLEGDNQKCLKWTSDKSYTKSGPLNMVIVYSIYETLSNNRPFEKYFMKLGMSHEIRFFKYGPDT